MRYSLIAPSDTIAVVRNTCRLRMPRSVLAASRSASFAAAAQLSLDAPCSSIELSTGTCAPDPRRRTPRGGGHPTGVPTDPRPAGAAAAAAAPAAPASGEAALLSRLARHLAVGPSGQQAGGAPTPPGGVRLGVGDDAAVLDVPGHVVVAVDVLVEGVHFRRDLSSWRDVGWKAVAVNHSDLAAMGARPVAVVVGLALPADVSAENVDELYAGMAAACAAGGDVIAGGDIVRAEQMVVSVTAVGTVAPGRAVRRGGARAGDALVVVGALGAPAAALAVAGAGGEPPSDLLAPHRRPRALLAAGGILADAGATAMLDVSDGLGLDVARLCRASGVAADIAWDWLPVAPGVADAVSPDDLVEVVVGGGEDYALVATLPADVAAEAARAAGAAEGVPAAVIGAVRDHRAATPLVALILPDGRVREVADLGWDHL